MKWSLGAACRSTHTHKHTDASKSFLVMTQFRCIGGKKHISDSKGKQKHFLLVLGGGIIVFVVPMVAVLSLGMAFGLVILWVLLALYAFFNDPGHRA